jgi:hypothetical protein
MPFIRSPQAFGSTSVGSVAVSVGLVVVVVVVTPVAGSVVLVVVVVTPVVGSVDDVVVVVTPVIGSVEVVVVLVVVAVGVGALAKLKLRHASLKLTAMSPFSVSSSAGSCMRTNFDPIVGAGRPLPHAAHSASSAAVIRL